MNVLWEELGGTKGATRIRKSNRQHNGQTKKAKQRSTKHTYESKDRWAQTPHSCSCCLIFGFLCSVCRAMFVLLFFLFWPLYCLFFFHLRHLIPLLVFFFIRMNFHSLSSRQEEFKDTKGVIGIRISKENRQHNGQKKKHKRTNNDLQNIHIKLKIEEHELH